MHKMLENKTFDEIQVGDSAAVSRVLRKDDIETWAAVTANPNVMTLKQAAPGEGEFLEASGVGMWGASMFSGIIGTQLPGIGSLTRSIAIRFLRPFPLDQQVTATIRVTEKRPDTGEILVDCRCTDAGGNEIITGQAEIVAPKEKICQPVVEMPKVMLRREDRYLQLLKKCEGMDPISTAVVHPCSDDALAGAIQAAEQRLIEPILVGPESKIQAIAEKEGLNISPYRLISTEHSHHAADQGVALVRAGEAEAIMKAASTPMSCCMP